MSTKLKGLPVNVYRRSGTDCTLGGITATKDDLILVDESIEAPFEVKENEPYLVIVKRVLFGKEYIHAEPRNIYKREGAVHTMFGGNFIYTSDSRFPSKQPIPVHDRIETEEEYKHLSQ